MRRKTVVWLGDRQHDEFRSAAGWLASHVSLHFAPHVEEALAILHDDRDAGAVVLAQPRRGVISDADVQRLRRAAPLALFVSLLGSWCEGETRSGKPLAGATRIAWNEPPERLAAALGLASGSHRFAVPLTATSAEVVDWESKRPLPRGGGAVLIHANRFAEFDMLADPLASVGFGVVWTSSRQPITARGVVAVLWNGNGCEERDADSIRRLAAHSSPAPLAALLSFPRADDRQRAIDAGAVAVFAKPFQITDLVEWVAASESDLRTGLLSTSTEPVSARKAIAG